MSDREGRISRAVPEAWEGAEVVVEHLIITNTNVLGVGGTSGILETTNDRGAVISTVEGGQQGEFQFYPWPSVVRIRLSRESA
jgi:hypothetical protein